MPEQTLTVELVDEANAGVEGALVQVDGPIGPAAVVNGKVVPRRNRRYTTDSSGIAVDADGNRPTLIPTVDFDSGDPGYYVAIGGGPPVVIEMPATDETFAALAAHAPIGPEREPAQYGWVPRDTGEDTPGSPTKGLGDLDVETGRFRYWNGSEWATVLAEAGTLSRLEILTEVGPATATADGYMTAAQAAKLAGIETTATRDQTGQEITTRLDDHLGSADWRTAADSGLDQTAVDARVAAGVADWAETGDTTAIPADKLTNAPPSGLDQTAVDARVAAGVADWAETGNTDQIPAAKIPPASDTSGLNQDQVDARVTAGVADWAETTNTDPIPSSKLTNADGLTQTEVDARVTAGVEDWAETGNTDQIPASKLANAPGADALTEAEVDNRIDITVENWAEVGDTTAIPADKLTNAPPSGLDQTAVDARVAAGVADWAETGNTDVIPAAKIPPASETSGLNQDQVDARVQAGVADWAETSNTDIIPTAKLPDPPDVPDTPDAPDTAGDYLLDVADDGTATWEAYTAPAAGLDQTAVDARVAAGVEDWAETGNTDPIPAAKLTNAGGSGTPAQNIPPETVTLTTITVPHQATGITEAGTHAVTVGTTVVSYSASSVTLKAGQYEVELEAVASSVAYRAAPVMLITRDDDGGSTVLAHTTSDYFRDDSNLLASIKQKTSLYLTADTAVRFAFQQMQYETDGNLGQGAGGAITLTTPTVTFYVTHGVKGDKGDPGTSGLDQTAVDARVAAGVADWAEQGDTTPIPADKLTNAPPSGLDQTAVDARVAAGVADWAETSNTDIIPTTKLPAPPTVPDTPDAPATAGDYLLDVADDGTATWEAYTAPAAGLDQTAVDARVAAGVEDWAEAGNTDVIPAAKIPPASETSGLNQDQVDARVTAGVADWAEQGDTSIIPTAKLPTIPNAPATWAEAGNTSDVPDAKMPYTSTGFAQAVNQRVEDWAETGNTEIIPTAKLPATTSGDQITVSETAPTDPADGALWLRLPATNDQRPANLLYNERISDQDTVNWRPVGQPQLVGSVPTGAGDRGDMVYVVSGLQKGLWVYSTSAGEWQRVGSGTFTDLVDTPNTITPFTFLMGSPVGDSLLAVPAATVLNQAGLPSPPSAEAEYILDVAADGTRTWMVATGGGSGDDAAVWAEQGDTSLIPATKLPQNLQDLPTLPTTAGRYELTRAQGGWSWTSAETTSGLTSSEVDARIDRKVDPIAHNDNDDVWPVAKLDAEAQATVYVAWRANDNSFTGASFLAGTRGHSGSPILIPERLSGNAYLGVWVEVPNAADVTDITSTETDASLFGDILTRDDNTVFVVDGMTGRYWYSSLITEPIEWSEAWLRVDVAGTFVERIEQIIADSDNVPDGLPDAPAAHGTYQLDQDGSGNVTWEAYTAPDIPNVPDAPNSDGRYELQRSTSGLGNVVLGWVPPEDDGIPDAPAADGTYELDVASGTVTWQAAGSAATALPEPPSSDGTYELTVAAGVESWTAAGTGGGSIPGRINGVNIFWGESQTSRLPDFSVNTEEVRLGSGNSNDNKFVRLRFNDSADQAAERYFTTDRLLEGQTGAIARSAAVNIDTPHGTAAADVPSDHVFLIRPGLYKLSIHIEFQQGHDDARNRLLLMEAQSGTDDLIIAQNIPARTQGSSIANTAKAFTLVHDYWQVTANKYIYALLYTGTHGIDATDGNTYIRVRRYLQIERYET